MGCNALCLPDLSLQSKETVQSLGLGLQRLKEQISCQSFKHCFDYKPILLYLLLVAVFVVAAVKDV